MPKGGKKYLGVCKIFMEMFIISMIFRQKLHICDGGFAHKSYNVGIMDMMIHQNNRLQVYVMAGIARSLILKLMGGTRSCNHHYQLMMRMMRTIICRILVVTIPCLDVVYSPLSFGSDGGAAATPHIHPPNKLRVEVRLCPDEKLQREDRFKMSLMSKIARVCERNIECEVTVSEKLVTVFLTFEDPRSLDRVKKILKTYQVETIKNGKPNMRKLSVKVVQSKKSDKSLLLDFDPELLKKLKKQFGEVSVSVHHPSFLDENFLVMSGLFYVIDTVSLKTLVKKTRRAKVYRRPDLFGIRMFDFRVAHPDCPGLPEKCKDMCETLSFSYEYCWKYIGDVDLPEVILCDPEFWKRGFQPIETNDKAEEIGFFLGLG
jgi:hypothetical protein